MQNKTRFATLRFTRIIGISNNMTGAGRLFRRDFNKQQRPAQTIIKWKRKICLTEEELAIGAMLIKGKNTRRDLVDAATKQPVPVPKEQAEEYERKVRELNVAKARKKHRATKRLARAKKQAEKIMESVDKTKEIYKKAEVKKKEVTYVVAKKHQTGRRARRPAGVKGRYRVVDPRQKKDKRSLDAIKRSQKGGKNK